MRKYFIKENGFVSAFILILLVTLGLMGAGAYVLMTAEGKSVAVQGVSMQVDYSTEGALYYAKRRLTNASDLDATIDSLNGEAVNIGNIAVTIYADTIPARSR